MSRISRTSGRRVRHRCANGTRVCVRPHVAQHSCCGCPRQRPPPLTSVQRTPQQVYLTRRDVPHAARARNVQPPPTSNVLDANCGHSVGKRVKPCCLPFMGIQHLWKKSRANFTIDLAPRGRRIGRYEIAPNCQPWQTPRGNPWGRHSIPLFR